MSTSPWERVQELQGNPKNSPAQIRRERQQIQTYDETTRTSGIKLMVDGPPKIGKSVFAASACLLDEEIVIEDFIHIPSPAPVIFLDTEFSAHWLGKFYGEQMKEGKLQFIDVLVENEETGEIDPCESWETFWNELVARRNMDQGTLVIDSLSDIFQWINSYLRIKILHVSKEDNILPSQWYWRNDKWESLLKMLRKMKCNVIATSKVKEEWGVIALPGQESARLQKTGNLVPLVSAVTPYWFDIIMKMRTNYDDDGIPTRIGLITGARAGISDLSLEKPNMEKVFNAIKNVKPELEW